MSDNPQISVIVPVYNTKQWLRRCLNSIAVQSFPSLEIILVDDGSLDGSGVICDEYARKDSRFKVIHQANAGQSCARNSGLRASLSKYIAFVDSDDWIHPSMLGMMREALELTGADIVNCGIQRQDEKGAIISRYDHFPCRESDADTGIRLLLQGRVPVVVWNKLFRREVFDGIRFPEGMYYEDEYLMPYIFDRAKKIIYLDAQLYTYNERQGSTIHSSFSKTDIDRLDSHRDHIKSFSARFPDLAVELQQRYYTACAAVFTKALVYQAPDEFRRDIFGRLRDTLDEIMPTLCGGNRMEAFIARCGYHVYTIYRFLRMRLVGANY